MKYLLNVYYMPGCVLESWCEMNDVADATSGPLVTFLSFFYSNRTPNGLLPGAHGWLESRPHFPASLAAAAA